MNLGYLPTRFEESMQRRTNVLLAALLQIQVSACFANPLSSVPDNIAQQMVKGKHLDLVWAAPDFDRAKGIRLGPLSGSGGNEVARSVIEYLPLAVRKIVRANSPYVLDVTVVDVQARQVTAGRAHARIEIEGRIRDAGGKLKVAFSGYASDSSTADPGDNARLALQTIASELISELFSPDFLKAPKHSPIIVSVEKTRPKTSTGSTTVVASQPALSVTGSLSGNAPAPLPDSQGKSGLLQSSRVQASPVAPVNPMNPTPPVTEPLPPLFPPLLEAAMKRGKGLAKVWTSPAYNSKAGFRLGEVRYETEAYNEGIEQYLPQALEEICCPDAPYSLQLRVVDLQVRMTGKGETANVALGVNGNLIAADGALIAAFSTRESAVGTGDQVEACRTTIRRVVLGITQDLK